MPEPVRLNLSKLMKQAQLDCSQSWYIKHIARQRDTASDLKAFGKSWQGCSLLEPNVWPTRNWKRSGRQQIWLNQWQCESEVSAEARAPPYKQRWQSCPPPFENILRYTEIYWASRNSSETGFTPRISIWPQSQTQSCRESDLVELMWISWINTLSWTLSQHLFHSRSGNIWEANAIMLHSKYFQVIPSRTRRMTWPEGLAFLGKAAAVGCSALETKLSASPIR